MKRIKVLLAIIAAIAAVGCDSGETPTETYNVNTTQPPIGAPKDQSSMNESIKSHPTMPDAAKKAVLGK